MPIHKFVISYTHQQHSRSNLLQKVSVVRHGNDCALKCFNGLLKHLLGGDVKAAEVEGGNNEDVEREV